MNGGHYLMGLPDLAFRYERCVVLILTCSSGITTLSEFLRSSNPCCVSFCVRDSILSPPWSGGTVRGQPPNLLLTLLKVAAPKRDHPSNWRLQL